MCTGSAAACNVFNSNSTPCCWNGGTSSILSLTDFIRVNGPAAHGTFRWKM